MLPKIGQNSKGMKDSMRNWCIATLLVLILALSAPIVWAEDLPPPPPDITPPVSTITEPANNATLTSNPVIVRGTASANNKQIAKVELVTAGSTGTSTYLCAPLQTDWSQWECRWVNPSIGSYAIHSLATDEYGIVQETLQTIQITVSTQVAANPDTTPPVLILLNPVTTQSGTFYSGIGSEFTIMGQTELGATVTINGNPVIVDPLGNFELTISTSETPQTFLIEAMDASTNKSSLTIILSSSWPSSTPTPTPTPSESPTPTPTPTPSPSESPTPTPSVEPGAFPDLNGHWAQQTILAMVAKNIITGYPDGTFKPDRTITRAEFCTILAKALNVSPETNASGFADVTGHWAEGFVAAMVRKGYIKGYPDGSFGPDRPIKRSEIAAIVDRVQMLPVASSQPTFSDVQPDFWAFAPIEAAAQAKILTGYPDGSFRPEQSATRAEAAVIINRILSL
jgi:hypothetical protein